jgi:hypothetical protein
MVSTTEGGSGVATSSKMPQVSGVTEILSSIFIGVLVNETLRQTTIVLDGAFAASGCRFGAASERGWILVGEASLNAFNQIHSVPDQKNNRHYQCSKRRGCSDCDGNQQDSLLLCRSREFALKGDGLIIDYPQPLLNVF